MKNIIAILLCMQVLSARAALQEQQLKPVVLKSEKIPELELGRTYNRYQNNRVLAPKKRSYPFLDQLEYLLYPGKDFKSENPGKRLERLEVATFGEKQKGSIATRLNKLKNEVESWQIANMQVVNILGGEKDEHAYRRPAGVNRRIVRYPNTVSPLSFRPSPQRPNTRVNARRVDYDRMNYGLMAPLVQSIGKKSIDLMFK